MKPSAPQFAPPSPLITAREVGAMLGISARAVYDIPDEELPRFRLGAGRGAVRFDPSDVEAYKAACRSTSRPALSPIARPGSVSLRPYDADSELMALFAARGIRPKLKPPGEAKRPPRKAAPKR